MSDMKIRFVVLDSNNNPMLPSRSGLILGDATKGRTSHSFVGPDAEANAGKFAQLLAKQNKGESYYVAKITAVASAVDTIDAALEGTKGVTPTLTPTSA